MGEVVETWSSHGSLASAQPKSVSDLIFHLLATLIVGLFIACTASNTGSGVLDTRAIKEAQVVQVIDGDTLDLLIAGTKYRVRLFGVDTPNQLPFSNGGISQSRTARTVIPAKAEIHCAANPARKPLAPQYL